MPLCQRHPLSYTHRGKLFSCAQVVLHVAEYPRMSERCPAYHYSVHSVAIETLRGLLRTVDVSVAYYRDVHPRILLHLADESPVSLAPVHLLPGSAVYGQGLDATVLQPLGQFHYDLGTFIPAQTGLDGNGLTDSLHDCLGNGHHLVWLTHHAGTCSPAGYLVDWASEIDVNDVAAVAAGNLGSLVGHLGGIYHRLGNVSVNLDSNGSFLLTGAHLSYGLGCIADEAVGGDEFCVHHIRAIFFADDAERCISHIFHRCQEHRLVAKINIPNKHKQVQK